MLRRLVSHRNSDTQLALRTCTGKCSVDIHVGHKPDHLSYNEQVSGSFTSLNDHVQKYTTPCKRNVM